MRFELHPHPLFPPAASMQISVRVQRTGTHSLTFTFEVNGDISLLKLPPLAAPQRTDNLWQTTCFEAFLRPSPGRVYSEFNFSPSSCWAAYAFNDHRSGMRDLHLDQAPAINTHMTKGKYIADIVLTAPELAAKPAHLALTTVIEMQSGEKSYWALAHPEAKPDFHHPDSFTAPIPLE